MEHPFIHEKVATSLVMAVDDTATNLQLVGNLLRANGFRLSLLTNGADALAAAKESQPDLILLDIAMPKMNGIEVCRRLKEMEETRLIPVVFLTVHSDRQYILEGFEAGAVDFVPKPFDSAELLSRVRTHLEIKHAREFMVHQNAELARLNHEKDEFLGITSHDLKNPLSGIHSLSELLAKTATMSDSERREIGQTIFESAAEMSELITKLLDINRIETQGLKPHIKEFVAQDVLHKTLDAYCEKTKAKSLVFVVEEDAEPIHVNTDRMFLEQIADNLVSNAVKFSPLGSTITVRLHNHGVVVDGILLVFEVQDEGVGISEEEQPHLYDKFTRLSAKPTGNESSTGLGLAIVKRLVEALGGKVQCTSSLGQGAVFRVELPNIVRSSISMVSQP